jgi:hypothetical protein
MQEVVQQQHVNTRSLGREGRARRKSKSKGQRIHPENAHSLYISHPFVYTSFVTLSNSRYELTDDALLGHQVQCKDQGCF